MGYRYCELAIPFVEAFTRDDVSVDPDLPYPDLVMNPVIQLKIYPNGGKEDNLVIVFIMASQMY